LGAPCSFLLARGAWHAQKKDVVHGSSKATGGQTTWTAKVTNACRNNLLRRSSQEDPVTVVAPDIFSRGTTLTACGGRVGDAEKGLEERVEIDIALRREEGGSFYDEKKLNELPGKPESIV